jgi:urea transport system substrate-binding protein
VAVVFGCWTSVSRKSVLPVFEELNGLLFYPVQYEGEEMSPNVFYTGAAPNQQAIPAVEYLMSEDGGAAKRFFLLGTDYVYPRTTNKILRAFLHRKGFRIKTSKRCTPRSVIAITRPSSPISRNSPRAAKRPWSRPSTAIPTCRSTKSWLTRAESDRCAGGGVLGGEEELRGIDTKPLVGNRGVELL